ncbi:MAG: UDP-N-acetylmuramoyl-tripeptide--D-alanyl-D-alanine ligase [Gemmatimonadetes bacterium]|nr:UDP-N-acetylmuramoyl-tripeptide--D-alanyl-D-alanine ligase [Gemmatimonadota bacterium]
MSAFAWTDAEVRRALGLRGDQAVEGLEFTGVSTDSRSTAPGHLYVALQGERFDGHDFVGDAVAAGARGAVVSQPVAGEGSAVLYPVDDTLVALGRLAAHRRGSLRAAIVGITGSSGKTSTKDLTAGALGASRKVHATRGNLNNRIGMPMTLLTAPDDADVVVVEMGTNEPGEIATLAAIARPTVGILTTVGESHLEKLGSVEGVLDEKLDLVRALPEDGHAIVGDTPPSLPETARSLRPDVRVAGWSERADEDLRPRDVEVDAWGAHRFVWRGHTVALSVPGRHVVQNALLALAVAEVVGVEHEAAARGVSAVKAGSMRGEVRSVGDLTLLVDCYNANPQSVEAALDLLEAQGGGDGRVAVLGTMLELGEQSDALHRRVLEAAIARDIDLVVATGAFARAADGLEGGAGARLLSAAEPAEAYEALRPRLRGHEVILLKGSRGVALESLLPRFEEDF